MNPSFFFLASANTEPGIAEAVGFSWPSFLAQCITFLIVFLILKKFAFKPLMEMLEKRRNDIEESRKNSERIQRELDQTQEKIKTLLQEANQKSEHLIAEAKESATALSERHKQEAITEANHIVKKASEASERDHDQKLRELKKEFGTLVIQTTSKVIGRTLSNDDQERLNREALEEITS